MADPRGEALLRAGTLGAPLVVRGCNPKKDERTYTEAALRAMDRYATRRVIAGLVLLTALGVWLAPWTSRDTVVVRPERSPARGTTSNQFSQVAPASPQQVEQVTRFLTGGVRLRDPRVLASWREERSYYFAAVVSGPRGAGRIGIWLIGGPKADPGMVLSVNATADAVSSAPWGPDTGASIYDREPDILRKYYQQ